MSLAIGQVAVPHYSSKALNAIVATRSVAEFTSSVRIVVILGVVASIFTFIRAATFGLAGIRLATRVRVLLFKNLLAQEMGFFDARETGELLLLLLSPPLSPSPPNHFLSHR